MSEIRPVVFSASSVNAYLDCHLKWWFTYVLCRDGEQSEPQAVGIAIHEAAEAYLQGVVSKESLIHVEEPLRSLERVFRDDILPTYRQPIAIEEEFQIEVNGIPYSGVIDSIDQHDYPLLVEILTPYPPRDWINILRDLKTTGSRPKAGRYNLAMTGYYLGATDGLDIPVHAMQLDYIVRTKTPYYWPEVVPVPDEDEVDAFTATLEGVAEGVAKGDFEPTGLGTWKCKSCAHRKVCGPYARYEESIGADHQD